MQPQPLAQTAILKIMWFYLKSEACTGFVTDREQFTRSNAVTSRPHILERQAEI